MQTWSASFLLLLRYQTCRQQTLRSLKSAVISKEQLVLRALRFDTNIDLPHRHLLNIARYRRTTSDNYKIALNLFPSVRSLQVSSSVVKLAVSFLNDISISGEPSKFPSHVTACCCLHVSMETLRSSAGDISVTTTGSPDCHTQRYVDSGWWNAYGVDDNNLKSGMFYFMSLL